MSWAALDAELDRWREAGSRPTLWWRDDDAYGATGELDTLLELAGRFDVPVALAAVPALLDASLAASLSARSNVTVIQHGYAHRNHAPAGERKMELGDHRAPAAVVAELAEGAAALRRQLPGRSAPVLVPPWNRVAPAIVGALPAIGLRGLSTFGPREAPRPVPEVTQCNAHVDVVDWRGTRAFVGAEAATAAIAAHLAARREGRVDAAEPTGILTHHLVHEPAAWQWIRELIEHVRGRAAWVDVATAFDLTCGRSA